VTGLDGSGRGIIERYSILTRNFLFFFSVHGINTNSCSAHIGLRWIICFLHLYFNEFLGILSSLNHYSCRNYYSQHSWIPFIMSTSVWHFECLHRKILPASWRFHFSVYILLLPFCLVIQIP
jgi:hypothetical protein